VAETGSFRLSFPALLSDSHSPQTVAERPGLADFALLLSCLHCKGLRRAPAVLRVPGCRVHG
jgi:hypothetical protein